MLTGFKKRLAAGLLAMLACFSVVVPAYAAVGDGFDLTPDTASADQWSFSVSSVANTVAEVLANSKGIPLDMKAVFWCYANEAVGPTGEKSLDYMIDLVGRLNVAFNGTKEESFLLTALKNSQAQGRQTFAMAFFNQDYLEFELVKHPSSGLLRIREKNSGRWVVNSAGEYPYCEGSKAAPTCGGNKWVGERSCSTAQVNMKNLDTLNLLCNQIKNSGTPAQIKPLGNDYKAIWWNRQYYCDPEGRPFVCYANEGQAAINQPRPDTSVKDEDGKLAKDENGNVIDASTNNNTTNIDLSGMTITLPNGDVQVADAVIYDESTKTYYIDSHDTTNYNITYNYSWTYHINYTSITYIGQTEQYNKYYEVYYELPDGRDSADLTAKDLEQLNLNLDVVNYGRYADDTSVRCLYHFDGDTRDSSYWSYRSNFHWNTGASLTYMDAGVFNGALYLDETEHDFTLDLPSLMGTGDFWMSWRYYQSATPAPQRDSYIDFGGSTIFQWDGTYIYDGSGTRLAQLPVGTWNEISIVRAHGVLCYYLNGVYVGGSVCADMLSGAVNFHFGKEQQTFKYFDELRILNVTSFFGDTNYDCPTVPYDTNLVLVLPDADVTPIADEYWSWTSSPDLLCTFDACSSRLSWCTYGTINEFLNKTKHNVFMAVNKDFRPSMSGTIFLEGTCLYFDDTFLRLELFTSKDDESVRKNAKMVLYYQDGSEVKPIIFNFNMNPAGFEGYPTCDSRLVRSNFSDDLGFYIDFRKTLTLLRIDFISDGGALSTYDKHTSVTGIAGEQPSLRVPTLAVKSTIDVTAKQIGGVRPSVPTKGLVWAMVEGGVIRSIQIYNGQAWEACDGRIFTGTRWVPYGSYNIITLKDFYDIVDASGSDFSYIYSETTFWNWWQKSWNTFTSRLFSALESAGLNTGGTNPDGTSRSLWDTIKDAFNNSLGALISALFDLIAEVLAALLGLVTDMLSFFFGFFTDSVAGAIRSFFTSVSDPTLFEFFQRPPVVGPDGSESSGGYGLPDEVGTAFAFISGVIMILPAELRSIMFFAIAAMAFLGVLKLVKS